MAGSEQAPSRGGVRSAKKRSAQRAAAPNMGTPHRDSATAEKRVGPAAAKRSKGQRAAKHADEPAETQAPLHTPPPATPPVRPSSPSLTMLSVEDLVRLLRVMGSTTASVELVCADIEAGAPTNADGSINFMHYAAWLERLGG